MYYFYILSRAEVWFVSPLAGSCCEKRKAFRLALFGTATPQEDSLITLEHARLTYWNYCIHIKLKTEVSCQTERTPINSEVCELARPARALLVERAILAYHSHRESHPERMIDMKIGAVLLASFFVATSAFASDAHSGDKHKHGEENSHYSHSQHDHVDHHHNHHEGHPHVHKEDCGHKSEKHKDHVDYQDGDHWHHQLDGHTHDCEGPKEQIES